MHLYRLIQDSMLTRDTPLFTLTPTIYMSVPYVNTFSPLSSALIVILPVDVVTAEVTKGTSKVDLKATWNEGILTSYLTSFLTNLSYLWLIRSESCFYFLSTFSYLKCYRLTNLNCCFSLINFHFFSCCCSVFVFLGKDE